LLFIDYMARRKGFEPLTPRFEVWCSIQLSYRRLILDYSLAPALSSRSPAAPAVNRLSMRGHRLTRRA
jgi:hypothetical protein